MKNDPHNWEWEQLKELTKLVRFIVDHVYAKERADAEARTLQALPKIGGDL